MRIAYLNILLLVLTLVTACKKDTPAKSTTSPVSLNSFTLKKDGVLYTPNHIFISYLNENVLGIETYMVYMQPENNTYAIQLRKDITPGTYVSVDGESEYFSIYHIQDSTTYFGWENSSLTILSNDTVQKVLHCTFEARLFNDEIDLYPEITDGEMTIHY